MLVVNQKLGKITRQSFEILLLFILGKEERIREYEERIRVVVLIAFVATLSANNVLARGSGRLRGNGEKKIVICSRTDNFLNRFETINWTRTSDNHVFLNAMLWRCPCFSRKIFNFDHSRYSVSRCPAPYKGALGWTSAIWNQVYADISFF